MPASSSSAVRNRAPCLNCQRSRRKCDSKKPSCTRCLQKSLVCCPSKQARWRMMGTYGSGSKSCNEQGSALSPSLFEDLEQQSGDGHAAQHSASLSLPDTVTRPGPTDKIQAGSLVSLPSPSHRTSTAGTLASSTSADIASSHDPFRLDSEFHFDLPGAVVETQVTPSQSNTRTRFDLASLLSWYPALLSADSNVFSNPNVDVVPLSTQPFFDKGHPLSSSLAPLADTEYHELQTSMDCLGPASTGAGIRIEHHQTDHILFPLLYTPASKLPADSLKDPTLAFVWRTYTTKIVTDLVYFGLAPHNPYLKHLARCAAHEPALFAAVSYWSMAMIRSSMPTISSPSPSPTSGFQLAGVPDEHQWQRLFGALEDDATEGLRLLCTETDSDKVETDVGGGGGRQRSEQLLTELCTMVTLCNAYIVLGTADKAILHLESALLLAKALWKQYHTDALYIFLVTWLGGIHTSAMLCEGNYTLTAPDFVEFAALSEQTYEIVDTPAACHVEQILSLSLPIGTGTGALPPSELQSVLFPDIINFTGISRALSVILYRTGCLYRAAIGRGGIRGSSRHQCHTDSAFWTAYATEIDDLEMRLDQEIARTERVRAATDVSPCNLDHYNLAFLYTAQLIYLTDITSWPQRDEDAIETAINMILDSCASVPLESPLAKFVILALFHSGLRSKRPLQQAFVRDRLNQLKGCYVSTNIPQVLELLQAAWAGSPSRYESSIGPSSGIRLCLVF